MEKIERKILKHEDSSILYSIPILLKNEYVDMGHFDVAPFFNVSHTSINIGSNGYGQFYIETNVGWKIIKNTGWIVLDKYEGRNSWEIKINLEKTTKTRTGSITIIPNKNTLNPINISVNQTK